MFSATGKSRLERTAPLRALRFSLNTPVVALEGGAVGPARAAVALLGGREGPLLTLALRAVRSDRVVLFELDEAAREWGRERGSQQALAAALSFAEGMGFLFDDDAVVCDGESQATAAWWEFLAEAAPIAGDAEGAGQGAPPLTKFRVPGGAARAQAARADDARRDGWVRLLSRF